MGDACPVVEDGFSPLHTVMDLSPLLCRTEEPPDPHSARGRGLEIHGHIALMVGLVLVCAEWAVDGA
jgi:hypothetical protein